MMISRKVLGAASTIAFLCLPLGPVFAMDDMKSMQPGTTGQSGSMGQKDSQPMPMGRDRMMMNDKMAAPPAAPMQSQDKMGQGSMNPQGSQGGMMMMMEKMMGGQMGGMSGAASSASGSGTTDATDRIEGRIAFLKAELNVSDAQLAEWNVLAEALRSGRQHRVEARKLLVMDEKTTSADRLERYERHLTERLEAIKSARAAFVRLQPTLNEEQKLTSDELLLPLIASF